MFLPFFFSKCLLFGVDNSLVYTTINNYLADMILTPLERAFLLVSGDTNNSVCPRSELRLILWWQVFCLFMGVIL